MRGCMIDKRVNGETDMSPSDIAFTDTEIILTTEPFIIESSKRHFEFDCTDDRLDFTFADISEIICPNVDSFTDEEVEMNGRAVQYHLYSPDQEQPLPLVFYNHGGGCTGYDGVLTDDCFASAWITGDAQEEFPCYVAAVYRNSVKNESLKLEDELDAMKKIADDLVKDGKVDPNRIYMAGESMVCHNCTENFLYHWSVIPVAGNLLCGYGRLDLCLNQIYDTNSRFSFLCIV